MSEAPTFEIELVRMPPGSVLLCMNPIRWREPDGTVCEIKRVRPDGRGGVIVDILSVNAANAKLTIGTADAPDEDLGAAAVAVSVTVDQTADIYVAAAKENRYEREPEP